MREQGRSGSGNTYSVFSSPDLENFENEIEDGVPAAPDAGVTELTFPISLLSNPEKAFFKVVEN